MKRHLPASLALALLSLLPACSTPGTTTGTKPAQKSGPSFGSQVGSAASNVFYGLLEIPYTILSIPADILGDPATMGAIAQVVETSYPSSSGSSGYSSSGSSGSGYTYQNASTRSSSSSGGGGYSGSSDDEDDDGRLSPREAVTAFEKSEMRKVEDFKRAMLGASSSGTGSGGRMIAPSGQGGASHSRRVPAISEGQWAHVGDFDGVRVWWKYRREFKDQVESALKMENLNSYKVTIEYTAWFLAADGTDYQDSGRCSMAPGAVKTGNTGGLFYYVKDARRASADPPRSGGIRDTRIIPQN